MSSNLITQPYPIILNPHGGGGSAKPAANAEYHVGEIDKDPIQYPRTDLAYKDESGTERLITSPIYTNNSGAFVASKNSSTIISPYMKNGVGYSVLITGRRGTIHSSKRVGDPGNITEIVSGINLIPNSEFSIAGSVSDVPDATPRSYSAGDELFKGFKAVGALSGVTYVDGKINGQGQLYVDVYKSEKQKLSTAQHVASIASSDGLPVESGASFVDNGDYWRVTFDMNNTFSVKFEQGSFATRHEVAYYTELKASSVSNAKLGISISGSVVPLLDGQIWDTASFYDGWGATILGPTGGARYRVVSKAEHDTARGTSTVDEKVDHTVGSLVLLYISSSYEIDVTQAGANVDEVTDSTASIQACFDSQFTRITFPAIKLITSAALVLDSAKHLIGPHQKRTGTGANVVNTGAGDCLTYSVTAAIYDATISDIRLQSTTGHAINVGFGAVRCEFSRLRLYTTATDKSPLNCEFIGGTPGVDYIGVYSCIFKGGEYIVDNVVRTAPIMNLIADGTYINENKFDGIWLTQSKSTHAVRLYCTANGSYLTNNEFDHINFEICAGGGIVMGGTSHTKIKNTSWWDTPLGYDGDLIAVDPSTSFTINRGLTIENTSRLGNKLNGAAKDISLGYSKSTVIINESTGATGEINFNGCNSVLVGDYEGTASGIAQTTFIKSSDVTANEFKLKSGNSISDGTAGSVELKSITGATRLRSTVSGNSNSLELNANTFFGINGAVIPATDGDVNLGFTSNRYDTVYATTGVNTTSDGNRKQQIQPLCELELNVSRKVKPLIKKFKFNDAVQKKGDKARWHFGVIAQEVKKAFESEGLNGFDYGVLCYDEWDDLLDEEGGVEVQAGSAYGIRYEELVIFMLASM